MNIILLTSTIAPPKGIGSTTRLNTLERENDYLLSLEYYLNLLGKGIDKIIFAENSKHDLSKIHKLIENFQTNNIEIISINGMDQHPSFGKGYFEFKLVDYVMKYSIIINEAHVDSKIWKISGRYKVLNILELLKNQPSNFDIYCNFKNCPKGWMDMYIFAWSKSTYENNLNGLYNSFNESETFKAPEFILRNHIEVIKVNKIIRFKVVPKTDAINGSNNVSVLNIRGYIKYYIRYISLKICPWIWI